MSEMIDSVFPFPGMEDSEEVDISAIFGGGAPTSDINPFDPPAAQAEPPAAPPEQPEPEAPAAPAEPIAASVAPPPQPEPVSQAETQSPVPASEPANPIAAAIDHQETQTTQAAARSLFEKPPIFAYGSAKDEIDALTRQRDKLTQDRKTDDLRAQIQQLSASLEYGNLSQEEYDQMCACKEELCQCSAGLNATLTLSNLEWPDFNAQIEQAQQEIKDLKVLISNVAIYAGKRAELTFEKLKINRVEVSLYDMVKSTGEQKAAFKFTYNGRRYDRLSLSEKIRAGMELSELVKRLTGRNYPVFVDNMESVDDLTNVRPTGQVIMAKCVLVLLWRCGLCGLSPRQIIGKPLNA